jgi:hypothetical protein
MLWQKVIGEVLSQRGNTVKKEQPKAFNWFFIRDVLGWICSCPYWLDSILVTMTG